MARLGFVFFYLAYIFGYHSNFTVSPPPYNREINIWIKLESNPSPLSRLGVKQLLYPLRHRLSGPNAIVAIFIMGELKQKTEFSAFRPN